jgi:alkylation response protein AidB-like acyl-CoA dehydrogenase
MTAQILIGPELVEPWRAHKRERYWRDARFPTNFESASHIQQHIIAERLLGKESRA